MAPICAIPASLSHCAATFSGRNPPGTALVVVAAAVGTWLYFARRTHALTEKDTIVLSDFTNTTGDAIFDDTLKTALNVSLRQSPLPMLSDWRSSEAAAQQMTRQPA